MNPKELPDSPFELFNQWYDEMRGLNQSKAAQLLNPSHLAKKSLQFVFGALFPAVSRVHSNSVILATASHEGRPSSRVVLLKKHSLNGFYFYTNYNSHKGRDLSENPQASLNFYWEYPPRQVRIYGEVKKTSTEDSDEYWSSRPRDSQLSSMASNQSSIIESKDQLAEEVKRLDEKYNNQPVPRPQNWGGYVLTPERFEFWQAKAHRLHHRRVFEKKNTENWKSYLLAP